MAMISRLPGVGTECRDGPPVVVAAPGWECHLCLGTKRAYDGSCVDCNVRLARKKAKLLINREMAKGMPKEVWRPRKWREVSEEEEDATLISILGLTSHVRNLQRESE